MTLVHLLSQRQLCRFWNVVALVVVLAPFAAADWQIVETQTIAPDVVYQALRRENPPTWAGVVRISLPMPKELSLVTAVGGGVGFGRQAVSQIAISVQTQKGYVTAAINGDYFSMTASPYSGDPLGLHIQDGELVSLPFPNRSALIGLGDGRIFISRFQVYGALQFPDGKTERLDALNQPPIQNGFCLYTPTFGATTQTPAGTVEVIAKADLPLRTNVPLIATVQSISETGSSKIPKDGIVLTAIGYGAKKASALQPGAKLQIIFNLTPLDADFDPHDIVWAIAGGPRLMRDGQVSVECTEENIPPKFAKTKHPRTAVGLRDDALFWVVIDGRQPSYSEGINLYEMAEFFRNLGCKDAINLDGGGSSTLFVRGSVVNRPSDGWERPIANALLLLNRFPPKPILRLLASATEGHWLANSAIPFRILGEDSVYRLLPLTPDPLSITMEPELNGWRWDGNLLFLPALDGDELKMITVLVKMKKGDATPAIVRFCVHPKPTLLTISPNPIVANPNASVQLQVKALGREPDGQLVPLCFDPKAVQWQVDGEVGIVRNGVFTAAANPKQGTLQATLNGVTVTVPVSVGMEAWQILHEFDDLSGLGFQGYPESTKVEGTIITKTKQIGKGALMLRYDFSQGTKTRAAYVMLNKPLPKGACQLALWVYGDGNGCWLRAKLRDATGKPIFVDFADAIDWKNEWREVKTQLPASLAQPLTLESIYLVVIRDEQRPQGNVVLDNLRVSGMPR